MVFTFDGMCKNCGSDIHVVFDVDESSYKEISVYAKCVMCGNKGDHGDNERIRHIMDTLDSHARRITFMDLKKVTLHNLD